MHKPAALAMRLVKQRASCSRVRRLRTEAEHQTPFQHHLYGAFSFFTAQHRTELGHTSPADPLAQHSSSFSPLH